MRVSLAYGFCVVLDLSVLYWIYEVVVVCRLVYLHCEFFCLVAGKKEIGSILFLFLRLAARESV